MEIKAESIEKSITKVRVNIEILEKKTVPISFKFSGIPAEDYRTTGEITSSRNSVELAGKSETLRGISAIEIPEGVIDVSGAVETVETVIDLRDYLRPVSFWQRKDSTGIFPFPYRSSSREGRQFPV